MGKEIKLSDYAGKYVVLFFYPLDFTFVCPTEIIAFNDRMAEFEALGCSLIACSTDSHFSHLAWCQKPRKEGGLGDMTMLSPCGQEHGHQPLLWGSQGG